MIPVPTIDAMDAFLRQTAQFGNLYLSDVQEAAILHGVRSAGAELLGTSSDAVAVVEVRDVIANGAFEKSHGFNA